MPEVHDTAPNPKRNSVYDVTTRVDVNETDLTAKTPRAHKSSYWQAGRDPYAVGGAAGQTFLNNPSTAPQNA